MWSRQILPLYLLEFLICLVKEADNLLECVLSLFLLLTFSFALFRCVRQTSELHPLLYLVSQLHTRRERELSMRVRTACLFVFHLFFYQTLTFTHRQNKIKDLFFSFKCKQFFGFFKNTLKSCILGSYVILCAKVQHQKKHEPYKIPLVICRTCWLRRMFVSVCSGFERMFLSSPSTSLMCNEL